MKKKPQDKIYLYLLIVVIGIAAFLRFYNFPYRYSLGEETVRDAVIGIEGARQLQFPLTGAFSSLGPFTFGPWYQYQLIFSTLVLRTLYSPWIYLSLASVLYVFIIYRIGDILLGEVFGLILSFLAAISPAQIISATHLTSHNMTNLFAVLTIWIFLKLLKQNLSAWWGFFLGFTLGVGMNLHFQMSGLVIFLVIILFYKQKGYIYFLSGIAGMILSFLPLLFFEANNHWFNTRNIIYFLVYGKNVISIPNRWLFYLRDFWPSFWSDALGVPVWMGVLVIIIFLVVLGKALYNKNISKAMIMLIITFLFNFLLLRYYFGPKFFGYLNYLRPFVFIFTSFGIYGLQRLVPFKYYSSLLILFLISFLVYPQIVSQIQKDPFTSTIYTTMSLLEQKYPNKKFTLYSCSPQYLSSYNAYTFSMLFLLEYQRKITQDGIKIGVQSKCDYPQVKDIAKPLISGTEILDFSYTDKNQLKTYKWTTVSFPKMYNAYARWWFQEQP